MTRRLPRALVTVCLTALVGASHAHAQNPTATFPKDRRFFTVGQDVRFDIRVDEVARMRVLDYNSRTVRQLLVEPEKPLVVTMKRPDSGIYWITDEGHEVKDSFAVLPPPVAGPGDPETWRFGLHYPYYPPMIESGFALRYLDAYQAVGPAWLRCTVFFRPDPARSGQWDWTLRRRFLEWTATRGLAMLSVFEDMSLPESAKPPWDKPKAIELMAGYVAQFKGKLKYYEVRNEANTLDVSDYFALHKKFYEAAKRADPQAMIVHTGIASPTRPGLWGTKYLGPDFQDKLLELGIDRYTDVYNFHFYPYQYDTADIVGQYMAVFRKHGVKKPVWITENGMWGEYNNIEKQRVQAEYLVRSAITSLAMGVDKYFWFLSHDHPVFACGLVNPEQKPKAMYVAFGVLNRLLGRADYAGAVPGVPAGVVAHRFTSAQGPVVVMWANRSETDIDLAKLGLPVEDIRVLDLMGRDSGSRKGTTLRLSTQPVFVTARKK